MSTDFASLPFESRQIAWDGWYLRAFRQLHGRQERPNVWECWVEGDRYFTRHGLLGGKMQQTSKKGKTKNSGRSNELTPEQDALAEARRLCRKKWDFEGYDEFSGEQNIDCRNSPGDSLSVPHLLASLPSSFCLYKPANNIDRCAGMLKKVKAGRAIFTLKRNGMAHWVVKDSIGDIAIYSRRNRPYQKDEGPTENADGTLDHSTVIPWTTRFPHLTQALQALPIPNNTMLAVELVHPAGDTKGHFSFVESITRSLTPLAIEKQEENVWLTAYIWDVPFLNGKDLVRTMSAESRYLTIHAIVERAPAWAQQWVQGIHVWDDITDLEASLKKAKEDKIEGYVVVDPAGIYGDRGWNLKGKPDRPSSLCAKAKPWYEDDFVVFWKPGSWGTYGKGRHEPDKHVTLPDGSVVVHGGVGSVGLGQYDSEGKLVYICDCASGMEYDFQAKLSLLSFPMVWEVTYTERSYISEGDKTNALTFPGLVRVRSDKAPEECINDKL